MTPPRRWYLIACCACAALLGVVVITAGTAATTEFMVHADAASARSIATKTQVARAEASPDAQAPSPADDAATAARAGGPSAASALASAYGSVFRLPRQWHPPIVHFPIACLCIEAILLLAYWRTRADDLERWSRRFLVATLVLLPVVVGAGLHDSGLDRGDGNPIVLGLIHRWRSRAEAGSTLTVHTWLGAIVIALVVARALWRWRVGVGVHRRPAVFVFAALVLVGVWTLIAAAAVGGSISHD